MDHHRRPPSRGQLAAVIRLRPPVMPWVVGATVAASGLLALAAGLLLRPVPGVAAGAAISVGAAAALARWVDRCGAVPTDQDAWVRRVRVADEVAERHRINAETAAAGMFELLAGLVAAEEGARGQLSAELHDTVAQSLMAARSLLCEPAIEPEQVQRAADLVAEAEDQVRALMARTRPPALREGDLARAIADLRDDLHRRYGLAIRLRWPAQPRPMPLVTAITVYRFFQEALLNVVKHADVAEVEAELVLEGPELVALVRDAGPGFDPQQVRPDRGRHVGLGLLRERARLAGGALDIDSVPGQGTTLCLRLPLDPAAAKGPTASAAPASDPLSVGRPAIV